MTTRKPATTRRTKLMAPTGDNSGGSTIHEPLFIRPPLNEVDEGPLAAGEQDGLMDIMRSIADATSAVVKVYRVQKNKPLGWMFDCSPESFNMDELRDVYGGGQFRVYVHNNGVQTHNIPVTVEPLPKKAQPALEYSPMLAQIEERMNRQDRVLEALAQRVTAPAPPPPTLGSMLGGLDLPATITAVGAVLNMLRPPPPPPMPAAAPAADPAAGIELLMKGFELARELGGGGGESSLMDVVRDLVKSPFLGQAIEAAALTQQPSPHASLPAPAGVVQRRPAMPPGMQFARPPNPKPPSQHTPASPPVGEPGMQFARPPNPPPSTSVEDSAMIDPTKVAQQTPQLSFGPHLEFLCSAAAADGDPELYAGLILDRVDDDTLLAMFELEPDPLTVMIANFPQMASHREWFEQVLEIVASAFDDGSDATDADGGADVVDAVESGTPLPDSVEAVNAPGIRPPKPPIDPG